MKVLWFLYHCLNDQVLVACLRLSMREYGLAGDAGLHEEGLGRIQEGVESFFFFCLNNKTVF